MSTVKFICFIALCSLCWSATPGRHTNRKAKTSIAWTTSWSHDDKYVAVGDDNGELSIYETTHWKKIKTWKYKATITRIEWNPKYSILAVAANANEEGPAIVQ